MTTILDPTPAQFSFSGIPSTVAEAICGPVAAMAFANLHKRPITLSEAMSAASRAARKFQSTPFDITRVGMLGINHQHAMMQELGIPGRLAVGISHQALIQEIAHGRPAIISTSGGHMPHYYVATAYDPRKGFFVGQSGKALRAGSEWMTAEQIERVSGAIHGAILFPGSAPNLISNSSIPPPPHMLQAGPGASPNVLRWQPLIERASKETGVPAQVIASIMDIESGGRTHDSAGRPLRSPAGAIGLMQVMPNWFQAGDNPDDPYTNILRGAEVLLNKQRVFGLGDEWLLVGAAYFGAYDPNTGQATGASDAGGQTGYGYVRMLQDAMGKYIGGALSGGGARPGGGQSTAQTIVDSAPFAVQRLLGGGIVIDVFIDEADLWPM